MAVIRPTEKRINNLPPFSQNRRTRPVRRFFYLILPQCMPPIIYRMYSFKTFSRSWLFFRKALTVKRLLFCSPFSFHLLLLFVLAFPYMTPAQPANPRPPAYSDFRGWAGYMLVQPAWQGRSAFDNEVEAAGFPASSVFGFNVGLGASYLFGTGTSVGLEFAYRSAEGERNGNSVRVQPHYYVLNIRQYLLDVRTARFFVSGSLFGAEQSYTFTRPLPPPASPTQAIGTNNVSQLYRNAEGAGFGLGLTFRGERGKEYRVTDWVEMETGYRSNYAAPFYTVNAAELSALPEDRLRQFYITMRAGVFVRGRAKR